MDIQKYIERIEDAKREFDKALAEARTATDDAMRELMDTTKVSKASARYARMYASRLQRDINNLRGRNNVR